MWMRQVKLNQSLAMKLSETQRQAIESLSEQREVSLAEAARIFLNCGIAELKTIA
jgi:hypothetical protein